MAHYNRHVSKTLGETARIYWQTIDALGLLITGSSDLRRLDTDTENNLVGRLVESLDAIEHAYMPSELISTEPPPVQRHQNHPTPEPQQPSTTDTTVSGDIEPNWEQIDLSTDVDECDNSNGPTLIDKLAGLG